MEFCDMRIQKKDIIAWLCLAAATLAALVLISARLCETHLSVRYYEVASEKILEPLRIVQLTDLHGHVFGEANAELAELVAEQQPDLIVMTGDMLDKTDADASVVCELIRALQGVAPIYYCHGNHEKTWMDTTGIVLDPQLTEAGAIVLDTAFADITVNGQPLRIGGYHGYYRYWGMLTKSKEQWAAEDAFSDAFEDTEQFKLLLCHIPTGWIDWSLIDRAPVDLVLTGHYHGGQIRIPFIGGLYAPYVGFFPKYTEGMFEGEMGTAILSTGLSTSRGIPRINNLPQVVVADLVPVQ